jgi:hypothetical protein
MTSLELFRALVPAMASIADATVEQYLTTASCRLCPTAFGTKWAEASVWLAAHIMYRVVPGAGGAVPGTTGAVSSLKTGDETINFATTAATGGTGVDSDLAGTAYGAQFLALRDSRSATAPTFLGVV